MEEIKRNLEKKNIPSLKEIGKKYNIQIKSNTNKNEIIELLQKKIPISKLKKELKLDFWGKNKEAIFGFASVIGLVVAFIFYLFPSQESQLKQNLIYEYSDRLDPKSNYQYFIEETKNIGSADIIKATNYFNVGEEEFRSSNWNQAIYSYEKSIQFYPTLSAYLNLGLSLMYTTQYDKALSVQNKGITLAKKKKHLWFEAEFTHQQGSVFLYTQDYLKAKENYTKARDVFNSINDYQSYASATCNLGSSLVMLGEIGEGIQLIHEAIQIHSSNRTGKTISYPLARDYNNLAHAYSKMNEDSLVLVSLLKGLEFINPNCNDCTTLNRLYLNLGNTYFQGPYKDNDKAKYYYKKCISIGNDIQMNSVYSHSKISLIYQEEEELDSAYHYGLDALSDAIKYSDTTNIIKGAINIGSIYAKGREPIDQTDIQKYLNEALVLSIATNKNINPIVELMKTISHNRNDINGLKTLDSLLDVIMESCSDEEIQLEITKHKGEIKNILIELEGATSS